MTIQRIGIERATVFYGQNTKRSLRRPPASAPEAVQRRFRELLRAEGIEDAKQLSQERTPLRRDREFRASLPVQPAVPDTSRYAITGAAATYDNLSEDFGNWRERILPGAFAPALNNRAADTIANVEHRNDLILGRRSADTLKLLDSPTGLEVLIELANTSTARDTFLSVQRGDLGKMSFAFGGKIEEEWTIENGIDVRVLVSIGSLFDVSIVSDPAYSQTHCEIAERSAARGHLNRRRLDALLFERRHAAHRRLRRAEILCQAG
ncbi:MAG TPA: HK97 family phage prohead protease [Pirellulales bacterium]|nr:HK97 family phage prohead protease [Pirellulales bacterium]